jgi:hypothetical protein
VASPAVPRRLVSGELLFLGLRSGVGAEHALLRLEMPHRRQHRLDGRDVDTLTRRLLGYGRLLPSAALRRAFFFSFACNLGVSVACALGK